MRTYLGIFRTDPNDNDIDNDNLPDGIEMGMRLIDFYMLYSNPKVNDSDNDSLNDYDEYSLNTEPLFDKDSDNDSLWDGEEVRVTKTSPTSKDTDGDGTWDGTEYPYSLGYTPQGNKALINGDASNLLPAGSEAPVTVEDVDMDWQPTLEMAYSLGFEGVKLFCLGDFAEGKITVSGAIDTGLCAVDVGAVIIPADGPLGEGAITSVKTARFIHGVKTWFNFQRVPNVLYKLQKANKALLRFKYTVKGKTEPISKELSKGAIQGASDLGIIWQKGAHGEILDAYSNLLKNYADDSGTIYYKIRELASKKVLVKDMERVYENGGELKEL
ncbi:hypothetical protein [Candidatus Methanoperedens nitratireducens]|uniref:Uncharacterized protein n=1 Tax=Candidatus Methanoperedens nitratireducens TaxID=1392998 RepID=A0A284VKE8_9EURY|nr:hypothetical protein [Candidatus Methanoperedens nitroreducens]SNQ59744.1 hypothetical protein MNV_1310001 [Candidatus Methanoperedens nitroreducens]